MARLETWIGVLDRSKKRLGIAFGLALLMHFPLTPGMSMLRLAHRLAQSEPAPRAAPAQPIEVELQEAVREEERRREAARAEPPAKDAAVQMAVGPADAAEPTPLAVTPKVATEKDGDQVKDLKRQKVKPLALEGGAGKPRVKPGVTLGLWLSTLRDSPLGQRLITIAGCDREWKGFLDQGVNPLNDLEGVLVVGPSLFDAAALTAAVRHTLAPERVHAVIAALIGASGDKGRWLTPEVGMARIGRGQRVLLPQHSGLFFVTPPKSWQTLQRVEQPLNVPTAEGRTASLSLVKPNHTLRRLGLTLPQRISELRLEVYANHDQSLDIKVELEATSSAAARAEAPRVSQQLRDFFADVWTTTSALRALTGSASKSDREPVPRLDLELEERTLSGLLHLSPGQTAATLNLLSAFVCRKKSGSK